MIKKMLKQNNSSIKYGGGYHNNQNNNNNKSDVGKEDKNVKKSLYREDDIQEVKKSDVYGELGVSKLQSKYRIPD